MPPANFRTKWKRHYEPMFVAKFAVMKNKLEKETILLHTINIANHADPNSIGGTATCPGGHYQKIQFNTGWVIIYEFNRLKISFIAFYMSKDWLTPHTFQGRSIAPDNVRLHHQLKGNTDNINPRGNRTAILITNGLDWSTDKIRFSLDSWVLAVLTGSVIGSSAVYFWKRMADYAPSRWLLSSPVKSSPYG